MLAHLHSLQRGSVGRGFGVQGDALIRQWCLSLLFYECGIYCICQFHCFFLLCANSRIFHLYMSSIIVGETLQCQWKPLTICRLLQVAVYWRQLCWISVIFLYMVKLKQAIWFSRNTCKWHLKKKYLNSHGNEELHLNGLCLSAFTSTGMHIGRWTSGCNTLILVRWNLTLYALVMSHTFSGTGILLPGDYVVFRKASYSRSRSFPLTGTL